MLAGNIETIYWSYEACQGRQVQDSIIGKEEFLLGYELIGLDADPQDGGGGFYAPTPEACETECLVREATVAQLFSCTAWTFLPNLDQPIDPLLKYLIRPIKQ